MASSFFIVNTVRTPIGIGKPEKGALFPIPPVKLASLVKQAVIDRTGISNELIDDVILGCVTPVGDQGPNIARLAALNAGFPVKVPRVQINRMCGSGQQSVHFAAQAILAGDIDLVIAGGIEMMSHQPLGSDYPGKWPADFPHQLVYQGVSAEMMVDKWGLSREELDDYAFASHTKAAAAIQEGRFDREILAIEVPTTDGASVLIKQDQGVRMNPDRERMAQLKPVFKEDGVITAGNSSQISDGAGALLIASERAVKHHNLKPLVRIVARSVFGSDPVLMLDAPIPATRSLLEKTKLDIDQIDVIELNEAFASVVLAWREEIGGDMQCGNQNGGAIAHGHPLGATGAVLMTKLVHAMQDQKLHYGLQAMCIGHGMATATIIESVDL